MSLIPFPWAQDMVFGFTTGTWRTTERLRQESTVFHGIIPILLKRTNTAFRV